MEKSTLGKEIRNYWDLRANKNPLIFVLLDQL